MHLEAEDRTAGRGRLKVAIRDGEVVIRGDRAGLESLARACLSIIGKHDPGGHYHFEWQMNNLLEGSDPMVVRVTLTPTKTFPD